MSAEVCPICETSSGGICRRCLAAELFSDESEEFELPEILGGFEVRERIGRGASGEVWLAFQPGPDREVALKVFLDPRLGGVADRSRFMAEAQALGKLVHPGIVPVYATGEEAGFLFIASRWMSGGTLAERRHKGMAAKEQWRGIVETMVTVTRAVAHAHRHGLVHRDIKPANILLGAAGEPYLADFGIAVNEGDSEGHYTSGTPAYMAPEQARGEVVTTSADVFSLGALMFDLLTGMPPLGSEEKLEERLVGIHPDLVAICRRCLEGDPGKRFESAGDLADDLERWLIGKPVESRPVGPLVRLGKWSKRKPGVAGLTGLVFVSALVLLGTLLVGTELLRKERNHAVMQEQVAKVNERRASIMATNFQQHSYAADMYAAGSALSDGQRGVAKRMLDRHRSSFSEEDIRDYAWYAYESMMEGDELAKFADHGHSVSSVEFSPDGKYFASAGLDGQLFVREMESRELVLKLPRDDAPVGAMEIQVMARIALRTPSIRSMLLSGELNPDEVRMRGRPTRLGDIDAMVWAPNGQVLVTAGGGSFVRLWTFPGGELGGLIPLKGVKKMAFSKTGLYLALLHGTPNGGHELIVYKTTTMEKVYEKQDVQSGFAVQGDRLALVYSHLDLMTLVSLGDSSEEIQWGAGIGVSKLAFSNDGERLIGLSHDGRILMNWEAQSGKLLSELALGDDSFKTMDLYQDGLVMAGSRQRVDFYRGTNELIRKESLRGHEDEILSLNVSPDGRWLVSGGKDRTVRLWKVPELRMHVDDGPVVVPGLKNHSPDARFCLGESKSGEVYLGGYGSPVIRLGSEGKRQALSFDQSGERAATWSEVGQGILIEWWSVPSGEKAGEGRIDLPFSGPYKVEASSGRGRFVVKGENSQVEFYELDSLKKVGELSNPRDGYLRMNLSPDGKRVAFIYWPRTVYVGEPGKGWSPKLTLTRGILGPLEFSPDGKWLVSGNDENRIMVHDAWTGKVVQSLAGHHQRVISLAMSPDGKTIASSSDDLTLRLWHVPTWRELGVLDNEITRFYLGFGDDSRRLCVGYWGDGGSRVLTIPKR